MNPNRIQSIKNKIREAELALKNLGKYAYFTCYNKWIELKKELVLLRDQLATAQSQLA